MIDPCASVENANLNEQIYTNSMCRFLRAAGS